MKKKKVNSDVIEHVLTSLVNVTSTKTSKAHALLTVRALLKKLENNYSFLKYINITGIDSVLEQSIDDNCEDVLSCMTISKNIDAIDPQEIGGSIQNIVDTLKNYLGKKAGYYFIREFRDVLGDEYHSIIKNMGVDLRLIDLQNELYNLDSTQYKLKDDDTVNIAYLEKKE